MFMLILMFITLLLGEIEFILGSDKKIHVHAACRGIDAHVHSARAVDRRSRSPKAAVDLICSKLNS